jgi:hypothetical protein
MWYLLGALEKPSTLLRKRGIHFLFPAKRRITMD